MGTVQRITAVHDGRCRRCKTAIRPGDDCYWTGHKHTYHAKCWTGAPSNDPGTGDGSDDGSKGSGESEGPPSSGPSDVPSPGEGSNPTPMPTPTTPTETTETTFQPGADAVPAGKERWGVSRATDPETRPQFRVYHYPTGCMGPSYHKPIDTLKHQQLWSVMSKAFPNVSAPYWRKATSEEMREALTTGRVPERIDNAIKAGNPGATETDAKPSDGSNGEPGTFEFTDEDWQKVQKIAEEEARKAQPRPDVTIKAPELPAPVQMPDLFHEKIHDLIDCVRLGIPAYLFGPAGTGKSTMADQVAQMLYADRDADERFRCQSFSGDTDSVTLFGYGDAKGNYHSTPFRHAWEYGLLWCGDEIDNVGDGSIVAGLNMALSNSRLAFPDRIVPAASRFRCVVNGNTSGEGPDATYIGRSPLDPATLDRFASIHVHTDTYLETCASLSAVGLDASTVPDERPGPKRVKRSAEKLQRDADAWIAKVRTYRAAVDSRKLDQVVITPRASMNGCRLLSIGWTFDAIEKALVWRGLDPETIDTIKSAAKNGGAR